MPYPTTRVIDDLSKVEETVAELYASATEEAGPNTAPVIRTVLANLVVYACGDREAADVTSTIAAVTGSHPCRAIVVQSAADGVTEARGSVSAICAVTERNDRELCGEIISISKPLGVGSTGLVLPLLITDVPLYLWAPCETAFEIEGFVNLMREADHVIVDSRRFHDLKLGLERAMSVCQASDHRCLADDLGWYALLPWREMIAQHFDPPVFRERLDRLVRIEINYAPVPDWPYASAAAMLMAAWLIKQLGLGIREVSPSPDGQLHISATQHDHPVEVSLSPAEPSAPAGSLISVTIQAKDDGQTATFVTKADSAGEVTASMECEGICLPPQVLELPHTSDTTLLHQALDSTTRDETYYETLGVASAIVSHLTAS